MACVCVRPEWAVVCSPGPLCGARTDCIRQAHVATVEGHGPRRGGGGPHAARARGRARRRLGAGGVLVRYHTRCEQTGRLVWCCHGCSGGLIHPPRPRSRIRCRARRLKRPVHCFPRGSVRRSSSSVRSVRHGRRGGELRRGKRRRGVRHPLLSSVRPWGESGGHAGFCAPACPGPAGARWRCRLGTQRLCCRPAWERTPIPRIGVARGRGGVSVPCGSAARAR
mmetsp:Transcript_18657/g.50151  ORF Transcript_18657/g.50151 Transcript_18657/m.50151 type:complete len:224 (+) Transcript_18657:415-1086(+)